MDLDLLSLNSPVIDFLNLYAGLRFEQFNRIDRNIEQFGDFQFGPDAFGTAGDGSNDADGLVDIYVHRDIDRLLKEKRLRKRLFH